MLKGFVLGVVATLLLAALVGFIAIKIGAVSANADQRPPQMERWAAKTSLHATLARVGGRTDPNPVAENDANLLAGEKLYAANCAICHGGAGGAPSNIAKGLYQDPPQFHRRGVDDDPPSVVHWQIVHGIRWTGMPSFGKSLSDKQLWQLTLFAQKIGHLPPAVQKAFQQVK